MTGADRRSGWWATLPLREVEDVTDVYLTDMAPTAADVCQMLAELEARDDVANPIVQAAIAQCWDFLELEATTCH